MEIGVVVRSEAGHEPAGEAIAGAGGVFDVGGGVSGQGEDVVVADTPWGKSGLSTCYDLRFPELYRLMIAEGAMFFLVASAWPMLRLEAWRLFNRCRAHENLAFLISCNCAGANQDKKYAGHSMIVDPLGQVVAEGTEEEDCVTAEIDPDQVNAVRQEFPALGDRKLT